MFTLTLAVGNASWPLVFKSNDTLHAALAPLHLMTAPDDRIAITDDFGQQATVVHRSFHGMLIEDMDKVKLAHIERQLYAARLSVDAQNAARSDPKLMAAARGQGPGVITPMGNGLRM